MAAFSLLAAFQRQLRQRAQRGPVIAAQLERRLVELDGAFGVAQLDLGLRRVRQGVRDLFGVERGVRVVGEAAEVHRGLAPAPGAEAVFAQRQLGQQLTGAHAVGLDQLPVGLVQLAELLVHLGEALEKLGGLLRLAAQAAHRLGEPLLRQLPLAFLVVDVGDREDRGQVVGDQRQRLVEVALRLGAVAEALPGGAGEVA